jgi:hypothetical protein
MYVFCFRGGRGDGRFWFVFACVRAGVTSCACMVMWQTDYQWFIRLLYSL